MSAHIWWFMMVPMDFPNLSTFHWATVGTLQAHFAPKPLPAAATRSLSAAVETVVVWTAGSNGDTQVVLNLVLNHPIRISHTKLYAVIMWNNVKHKPSSGTIFFWGEKLPITSHMLLLVLGYLASETIWKTWKNISVGGLAHPNPINNHNRSAIAAMANPTSTWATWVLSRIAQGWSVSPISGKIWGNEEWQPIVKICQNYPFYYCPTPATRAFQIASALTTL